MAIKDAMLPEFDHEMGTTRRLLERTPEAEFAWKPHDKSFSLGQLAGHIANIPHWVDAILQHARGTISERQQPAGHNVADLGHSDARRC